MPKEPMTDKGFKLVFWVLLNLFILTLVANAIFFVMPMLANLSASFAPARTITVSAEGKTTAAPDTATVAFSVVTQGKNPDELTQNNNDKINAALDFVKSQGIAEADLKTTSYDLSPNYGYDRNTQRNYITGYTLTQSIEVKVHDFSKVAAVIGGLTPLGVNQIGGVNFSIDDPDKALTGARADAMNKAQMKAEEIAAQAGARLGRVVSVDESSQIPPIRYESAASMSSDMAPAPVPPTIQPGTQDLTVNENVTYAIE